MTSRERLATVLNGGQPDRVPICDTYWGTTVDRWRREGLPEDVSPDDYFGLEMVRLGGDETLQLPTRVLEETDAYRLYVDPDGVTRKDFKNAGGWTPHWLDFTIQSRADWEAHRHRLAYHGSRLPPSAWETYRQARAQGRFVVFGMHACFHGTWSKVGQVNLFVWMAQQPDLVHEMFQTYTQMVLDTYEAMKGLGIEFDGAWLSDDLGSTRSPFISPAMYRDLVFPYHQQACAHFARDGLHTILHSDGNVAPLIPHFLEAGFRALHPLEAKAGLDVRKLKGQYGNRLVLFGNVDVRVLARTKEAIEAEVRSKLTVAKEGGGYIYHSDHSVPDDVSLDNYRFALEMVRKYGAY